MSQSEHLLVDGYNLIRAVPRFGRWENESLQRARHELQKALRDYIGQTGARVELYYDGDGSVDAPNIQPMGDGLCVYFAHKPELADDLIKAEVQLQHGAKRLRVITSDRDIRNFARRHKIRSTASDAFDAELEQPPLRPKPLEDRADAARRLRPPGEAEVNEWERLFTQERDKYVEDDEVEPYRPAAVPPPARKERRPKDTTPAPGKKPEPPPKPPPRIPPVADRLEPRLNRQDIDEWERLFTEEERPDEDQD
jgi:uncharacterized protein